MTIDGFDDTPRPWDGPMKDDTLDQLVKSLDSRFPSDRRMAGFEMYRRLRELVPLLERAEFEGKHGDHVTSLAFVRQAITLAKGGEEKR